MVDTGCAPTLAIPPTRRLQSAALVCSTGGLLKNRVQQWISRVPHGKRGIWCRRSPWRRSGQGNNVFRRVGMSVDLLPDSDPKGKHLHCRRPHGPGDMFTPLQMGFGACLHPLTRALFQLSHSSPLQDGACDDGGSGAEYSLCRLGTDCQDCGSRSSASSSLLSPLSPSPPPPVPQRRLPLYPRLRPRPLLYPFPIWMKGCWNARIRSGGGQRSNAWRIPMIRAATGGS